MRHLALFGSLSLLTFGIVHCVGDEPSISPAGGDAAASEDGSGSDGSTGGDGSSQTDGATDAGPDNSCITHHDCPTDIEPASLQLWLRGDLGENCVSGHVTKWSDQSGKGNDAVPGTYTVGAPILGPECGIEKMNGLDVPSFNKPLQPDAGAGITQFFSETLEVNLGFLVMSDFTILMVHQRKENAAMGLIGRQEGPNSCPPPPAATTFSWAYTSRVAKDGGFGADYTMVKCENSYAGSAVNTYVANTPTLDELVFASAIGHTTYSNTVSLGTDATYIHQEVPSSSNTGVIGRTFDTTDDRRYHGNIAEIIVYNTALTDGDRQKLEAYLKRQWALPF